MNRHVFCRAAVAGSFLLVSVLLSKRFNLVDAKEENPTKKSATPAHVSESFLTKDTTERSGYPEKSSSVSDSFKHVNVGPKRSVSFESGDEEDDITDVTVQEEENDPWQLHNDTDENLYEPEVNTHQQHSFKRGDMNALTASDRSLVIASTVDGKVTALDMNRGGEVWNVAAGDAALVSSSLSSVKFNRYDRPVRLIPSLDGSVYQFDGRSVEPMPFTAATLLQSSSSVVDDVVMVGGKGMASYGVDRDSGKIRYACTAEHCKHFGDTPSPSDATLVITRNTQTVRAVDMRTGVERWNFSVATHNVQVASSDSSDSAHQGGDSCTAGSNCPPGDVRVVVPDGVIVLTQGRDVVWRHQLASPVAGVWVVKGMSISQVDLFDDRHVPALSRDSISMEGSAPPMLYLGHFKDQLYIQPSVQLSREVEEVVARLGLGQSVLPPRVNWKPYLASAPSRTPHLITREREEVPGSDLAVRPDTLDYPFDNGLYLFADSCRPTRLIENKEDGTGKTEGGWLHDPSVEIVEMITHGNVLHYWREILACSLLLSFIISCAKRALLHRVIPKHRRAISETHYSQTDPFLEDAAEAGDVKPTLPVNSTRAGDTQTESFNSRFYSEFKALRCLGKGGFGIVFEAENKLDETSYAIKRITLPHEEHARKRVLREVRALAKLEHPGIVRYFQCWEEQPPPEWQREMDRKTLTECNLDTGGFGFNELSTDALTSYDHDGHRLCTTVSSTTPSSGPDVSFSLSPYSGRPDATGNSLDVVFENTGGFAVQASNQKEVSWAKDLPSSREVSSLGAEGDSGLPHVPFGKYGDTEGDSLPIVFVEEEGQKKAQDDLCTCTVDRECQGCNWNRKDVTDQASQTPPPHSRPRKYLYIQMQLCRRDTLKDWLLEQKERDRTQVLSIFRQIADTVEYVHDQGMMHRDLKPNNIFFSLEHVVKIGDFGLVRVSPEAVDGQGERGAGHTGDVGTEIYMSPEQLSGARYCHKVDIFALGLILFEMLLPFSTAMERIKTLQDAKHGTFPPDFVASRPTDHAFVSWLLHQDPEERPSATEVINSHILKDLPVTRLPVRRSGSRTVSQSSSNSLSTS